MTDVVSGRQFGVGTRRAILYALNASGSPAATDITPYTGVQVVGAKTLDITIPDARKITHVGDDAPLQVDFLPPTEAISGSMDIAEEDQAVYALLTGTNSLTIGESKVIGIATSKQGFESQVGLLVFQQSLSALGVRNWRWMLFPKAVIYPHPSGFNDNAAVHKYQIAPAVVAQHLWETVFSAATTGEGYTRAQGLIGQSRYMPSVVAWLATTGGTQFAFPALEPAADVLKAAVFVNGVADTAWTISTTQIATTGAPGNGKRVVCFYEHQ
jgi:hypothetical protein